MAAETRWTVPRSIEVPLVIAIALMAIIFRFARFNQVPPGLHYDEAIDARLAREIQAGASPVYFEEGWGREPLYHYLVAVTLNFTPDATTALRVTSGLLGLIQLAAAYLLFRSLFGVPTALIGAAWIAVLFWTVSTSRAGLRNITLTTLTTLTAWAFWNARCTMHDARGNLIIASPASRILHPASRILHPASFILPGLLLGLTLYTYQPSRVAPLIYLVFAVFLAWRQQAVFKQTWRGLALFFGVTLIVALPLIVFLATHPQAETGRAFQTEPIRALLSGNFQPALDTAVATLKMFTFDGGGDPQILYNLSGRPIFIGLGSILFYLGLIVCIWRWKQPAYTFMLIWLAITLLPNMLTAPAPFFYRAIAAQTPVALLPAIGVVAIGKLFHDTAQSAVRGAAPNMQNAAADGGGSLFSMESLHRDAMRPAATRTRADAKRGTSLAALVAGQLHLIRVGLQAIEIAPVEPLADRPPFARLRAGSAWTRLRRRRPTVGGTPLRCDFNRQRLRCNYPALVVAGLALVALGQTAITTWHDYFDVWGRDADVRFQYSAALTDLAHTLDASPDTTPVAISSYFIEDADPIIFEQTLNRRDVPVRWFDAREALMVAAGATSQRLGVPSFTPLDPMLHAAFLNNSEPGVATKDFKLYAFDAAQFRRAIEAWTCAACPVSFNNDVTLIGLEYSIVDKTLIVQSAWRVRRDGQPSSTKIFMHLNGADGQPAAQDDRLGVPRHTWRTGDEFVQVHRIPLSGLSSGAYPLELGIYNWADKVRWSAADQSGAALGDHVRVGLIEVSP